MSGAFLGRDRAGKRLDNDGWNAARLWNWSICFILILALHIGVLWTSLHWASWLRPVPPPIPAAMMIDLAPLPAAPPVPQTQAAPGPKQTISQPPPVPQVQLPLPPPPPSPAPKIDVPVPPRVKLKPLHHKQPVVHPAFLPQTPDQKQPEPATTAPPQLTAPMAPAEAPVPGVSPENSTDTVASWQSLLLGRLEQFKHYPSEAQMDDEEGVAYLHFTMDRRGKILSANIATSSGYAVLDQETLALVYRAEPLPPPPPSIPGDPIELTVPVQFFLHQ